MRAERGTEAERERDGKKAPPPHAHATDCSPSIHPFSSLLISHYSFYLLSFLLQNRTDAFGVLTYVSLAVLTPNKPTPYLAQAAALVRAVESTLGRERGGEEEGGGRGGETRPPPPPLPRGGLRIGKPGPPGTNDGDGQYLHYLLKWSHALCALARATGVASFSASALNLIRSTHPRFIFPEPLPPVTPPPHRASPQPARRRFFWKALPDLSGPAPDGSGEGGLDAFGAVLAYRWAAATAAALEPPREKDAPAPPFLAAELAEAEAIAAGVAAARSARPLVSLDPLDAGDALWTAAWVSDPAVCGAAGPAPPWARQLETDAIASLASLTAAGVFTSQPPRHRLAFREFGALLGAAASGRAEAQGWLRAQGPAVEGVWMGARPGGASLLFARDADITPVMAAAAGLGWGGAWAPPARAAAAGGVEDE